MRPRVVIVGAGFAGLNTAHALRRAHADVTIVDGHDYRTFQPLLYQVSTGYLGPEEVGAALRAVFRRHANVRVRIGKRPGWTTRLMRSFSRAAPGSTLTT